MIKRLSSLEKYKNAFVTKDNLKKFVDLNYTLFVVDTHKPSYTISKELINGADTVVVIDHHRRGTEFVENAVLSYHELYASSACELVTELLMYVPDFKLDVIEAEALYAGILLDTKNYTFKTGVRTFEVSAYLRKFGIDISSVKSLFKIDFDAYLAKTEIVRNAEFIDDTIAISICEEKTDDDATLTAQVADELLNINNVEASFVLCKIDSVIMISGRSNGDINVQTILEKLGGGGHITFAGTQILGISILEAKEKLLDVIYNYLES